ncbi:hypothetical protein PLICRDRAFT_530603 [Plicaturopsis crispa FD-325 SS-3]|nr:hypothetical protein PLICRDRAFT_530603 [Plicaturopsis crispa FD-325 SS-3]
MRLKLRTEKSLKSYFGPMEARLIIEHMLDRPRCYNLALGQVIATLFELMLGARPSSLYAVQNYKDCYMCFRDVEVIREDGRGYFTIIVTLRWFKGYHAGQRIKIRFRLGPTRTSHGLIMDVGCCTVAYGLRLGFFKNHTSLQSLIDGDELHIEWKDEVLNQPFFRAGGPRGMSLTSSPLSDKGRREYLRLVFEAVGLPVTTGYAFRRHFARVMRRGVGAELTRQAMGHNAGSTALETHYDDGVEFVDFVGHMLAKEDAKSAAQMQDGTEAALRRGAANRKPPVLSFAQLLQRQPALAVLAELIHNMKLCLEDGAVDWKSHTVSTPLLLISLS